MVDNSLVSILSNPIILGCQKCSHRWTRVFVLPIMVDVFISRIRAEANCPRCKNKSREPRKCILILDQYTLWTERDN